LNPHRKCTRNKKKRPREQTDKEENDYICFSDLFFKSQQRRHGAEVEQHVRCGVTNAWKFWSIGKMSIFLKF
jgi:hypothetical protein